MFVLQFVLTSLLLNKISCISETEYLKKLIAEWTSKTETYQLPKDNIEFKLGAQSKDIQNFGDFDFIIVGAGSAGSVLATRLSEIDEWNILLLETGGEENDYTDIPAMGTSTIFSELSWPYYSTSQRNACLGMKHKQCMAARGKAIGGSSTINGLMYTRGNADDYNSWVRLGNPGWSYEEVLPYFKKSENSQINGDPGYHAKGGLWNVQYSLPRSQLFDYLIDGLQEMNQSIIDHNGLQQLGAGLNQLNIKHGKRQSTGTAFLDNARQRKNLKVVTKALATEVVIDKNKKIAHGVVFVRNNTKFIANARLEVILSAGVFNSPQLLMLSGIGPRKHLNELGIDVIANLPVGQNLAEQLLLPSIMVRTNFTNKITIDQAVDEYVQGLGPLTNPWNADILSFLHAGDIPPTVPMIECAFISPNSSAPIMKRFLNFNEHLTINFMNQINPQTDLGLFLILLHPKSRGNVTLKSRDPTDFPKLDFNFFDCSNDIDNFIEGIDFALKIIKTEAFRKLNATLVEIPICQEFGAQSRLYWECVIRNMATASYHAVGTTPMGPNPKTSVVGHNLQVHGIKHLRVVDAGVIPTTVSGHTNAPTVMIAEKIADVIKATYK